MSYYESPEQLAANPPETWRVIKRGERRWGLFLDSSAYPAELFRTQREALAERDDPTSYTRRMVEQERRWHAGETPPGWKTYAECQAGWQRLAERQAERAGSNPNYRAEQWP